MLHLQSNCPSFPRSHVWGKHTEHSETYDLLGSFIYFRFLNEYDLKYTANTKTHIVRK